MRDARSHNATHANQPGGDRNNLLATTLRRRDKALTFVDVLVQLVNERVQMLPLLARKLERVAGVHPLTQRTGNHTRQRQTSTAQTIYFKKNLKKKNFEDQEEKVYLVPMP